MNNNTKKNNIETPTNKELLVRIDERQKFVLKEIAEINKKLDTKLDCKEFDEFKADDFRPVKDKGEKHEKNWDRFLGYMFGSGIVGGTAGAGIAKVIATISALAFGG
jgi:hypothetical protein